MMNNDQKQHRSMLQRIARKAMIEKGLMPDFSPQAIDELSKINGPVTKIEGTTKDLRNLLWCSIDNDDSLDLDQLTVAIPKHGNSVSILIAIADVVDRHLVPGDVRVRQHRHVRLPVPIIGRL